MFSGAGPFSFEERGCFLFASTPLSQCASNTAFLFVVNVKALLSLEGLGAIPRWQMRGHRPAPLPLPPQPNCPFTAHDSLGEQQALGCPALDCVWDAFSAPGFARNMTGPNEKALLKNALRQWREWRRRCNLGGRRLQSVGEESEVAVCLGETRRFGARGDGILKYGSVAQRSNKEQRRISLSTSCCIHSLF